MQEQNFKNHSRFVPLYHFFTYLLLLVILVGTTMNCCKGSCGGCLTNVLIGSLAFATIFVAYFARAFALKAQDRAIRAEENLRYFAMTGKLLPTELRMGQIIALRFANDEEWLALINRAVAEKLSSKDIKLSIKNWKADYNRV
ncbi:MAG: DUF6526 family protein [Chitinophagaceae bacterium]